ncbi:hypothetical protein BRC79_08480 [Halobacteriales archaeon QH_8_67_27]|nr:MAG: hypothetical protein BRC79_08480 [Halobacteriales archaeon QH_8_67_27]
MSRADRSGDQPRAMIHRRILDVAASEPDASLAAIADEVSGASADLVERVLDEYGDPGSEPDTQAEDDQSMNTTNATESGTEQTTPDGATATQSASSDDSPTHSLSEKQRRTLRALYEQPEASQGDLADELDVTRATVSRRLNAIPGFEWSDRRAFAESVFGSDETGSETASATADGPEGITSEPGSDVEEPDATNEAGSTAEPDPVDRAALDAVESRVAALEDRLASIESAVTDDADGPDESAGTGGSDGAASTLSPELTHKVAHACMESDRLTADEELDVLRALMQCDD